MRCTFEPPVKLKFTTLSFMIGYKEAEERKDYTVHLVKHMTLEKYKKKDNTFGSLPDQI